VNYLRCHDDIGWTFDDADAEALGINAYDHRQFLNQFYTGQFKGSFARGIPFQENATTGDMRIAGTLASLAGLELAIESDSEEGKALAIKRMLLLQGVTLSIGGIPLIYLGEEWAMLNDYDFVKDPAKAGDTRWVHRPKMRWEFLTELDDSIETAEGSIRKHVFRSLQKMISARKFSPALAGQSMDLVNTKNPHLLGFVRYHDSHRLIVLANFCEDAQVIPGNSIRTAGMGRFFEDLLTGITYPTSEDIEVGPYQILWLSRV
jgi:amylosucrase